MVHVNDRQNGFALAAVLLLVAIASILGLGYLVSSTVRMLGSENLLRTARAQYLGESALQHALYILQKNPQLLEGSTQSPLGPYVLDDSDGCYYFSGGADETIPRRYYLYGEGHVGDIVRRCSYTVFRSGAVRRQVLHGMIIGGSGASLPAS